MNVRELRSLRGQIQLTFGLYLISIALALVIVSQRSRFEFYMAEKYSVDFKILADKTKDVKQGIDSGKIDHEAFDQLNPSEQAKLYDLWMQDAEAASKLAPAALAKLKPEYYIPRAEQTVVCGNSEQRSLALKFLLLSESPDCGRILDRLAMWAQTRQRGDWFEVIDQAREQLAQRSNSKNS